MSALISFLNNNGPSSYYTTDFRNVIEEHLVIIKNSATTSKKIIDPHLSYRYENNLFGLLLELKYQTHFHWPIMRVNNYHNPMEFKRNTAFLYIPSVSFLEQLLKIHNSKEDYI